MNITLVIVLLLPDQKLLKLPVRSDYHSLLNVFILSVLRVFRHDEDNMVAIRKSDRVCVGLFGWINKGVIGELGPICPGTFTGHQYVEILKEVRLLRVRSLLFPVPQQYYIVQDNSPIHMQSCQKVI